MARAAVSRAMRWQAWLAKRRWTPRPNTRKPSRMTGLGMWAGRGDGVDAELDLAAVEPLADLVVHLPHLQVPLEGAVVPAPAPQPAAVADQLLVDQAADADAEVEPQAPEAALQHCPDARRGCRWTTRPGRWPGRRRRSRASAAGRPRSCPPAGPGQARWRRRSLGCGRCHCAAERIRLVLPVTTQASGCGGVPAIDLTRRAGPSAAITCRIPDLGDQHDRPSEAA